MGTDVMAANMPWYRQKSKEGMRVLPIDGFSRTPLRPKYSAREGQKGEGGVGRTTHSGCRCTHWCWSR